jgi:hypothetical protein
VGETENASPSPSLDVALAALRRDYSKLAPRLRDLTHSIKCDCESVTLRLHYPAFRDGLPTVHELIESLVHYLVPFALPRTDLKRVEDLYGKVGVQEFTFATTQLYNSAIALFKRAQQATGRNGEAGELLLYILTEWALEAPQILAKMSLKTKGHGGSWIRRGAY